MKRIKNLLKIVLLLYLMTLFMPVKFCIPEYPGDVEEEYCIVRFDCTKNWWIFLGDNNELRDWDTCPDAFIEIKGKPLEEIVSLDIYDSFVDTYFILWGNVEIDQNGTRSIEYTDWDIMGKLDTNNHGRKLFPRRYLTVYDLKGYDYFREFFALGPIPDVVYLRETVELTDRFVIELLSGNVDSEKRAKEMFSTKAIAEANDLDKKIHDMKELLGDKNAVWNGNGGQMNIYRAFGNDSEVVYCTYYITIGDTKYTLSVEAWTKYKYHPENVGIYSVYFNLDEFGDPYRARWIDDGCPFGIHSPMLTYDDYGV